MRNGGKKGGMDEGREEDKTVARERGPKEWIYERWKRNKIERYKKRRNKKGRERGNEIGCKRERDKGSTRDRGSTRGREEENN